MTKNNESGKKSKTLPVVQNLRSLTFPSQLDWSPNQIAASLESVYEFVNNECREAIGWYYHKKRSKKFLGVFLRIGAIFAAAVAGVIPIIGEIFKEGDVPLISPAWSTIFLAIAAVLVALDQFGGATSGWVR
ncbi:MAG: SLATT domain-containing protein [Cyanobacteria bacterium P01_H01_bin.15]